MNLKLLVMNLKWVFGVVLMSFLIFGSVSV